MKLTTFGQSLCLHLLNFKAFFGLLSKIVDKNLPDFYSKSQDHFLLDIGKIFIALLLLSIKCLFVLMQISK